jgi:hypothetical protein
MTAKKQPSDRSAGDSARADPLAFLRARRGREEILAEAMQGLKADLESVVRKSKMTLDA